MLTRIISIKNVGRFRNSAAQPNPAFGRRTFLFGANGYGKSTLCAILRSLGTSDPALITGRKTLGAVADPEIDLLFAAGNRRFQNGAWSAAEPLLSIFDGTFVAENVHSGDVVDLNHKRSLYRIIIGRAGVHLAEQEQDLSERARAKQAEVTAAERAVQAFVPAGYQIPAFVALAADPDVDQKIEAQEAAVGALRQAEAIRVRPLLSALPVLELNPALEPLLARSLAELEGAAEEQVRTHIARHGMERGGQRWLTEGLAFNAEDECPFCGQGGISELALVRAYRAFFGDAYRELRDEIDRTKDDSLRPLADAARAAIRTTIAQNAAGAEFWARHCAMGPAILASVDEALIDLEAAHDHLADVLGRKSNAPLHVIEGDPSLAAAGAALARARVAIGVYNDGVRAANALVQQCKEATAGGDLLQAEGILATLKARKQRHTPAAVSACDAHRLRVQEKAQLETQKTAVRTRLEAHTRGVVQPYQARINFFLDRFNAGFRIVQTAHGYPGGIATSSYQIQINNTAVDLGDGRTPADRPSFKNTLSSGDRTTLALAFFLAGLESEPDLANRIIVFDDPFNSQDAFRRHHTIYEILRVAGAAAQIIVLSHDPSFLKQIWEKCTPADRVSLQIAHHNATGSKITSFDLATACQGRAQQELDDLLAFRATGAGNLREVIKKLRVVIETYMRSTYPGSFGANDNYGVILNTIRAAGDQHPAHADYADLDRINDYTNNYHHGENPGGAGEPPLDQVELTGFVEDTLRMVNALPT